MPQLLSEFDTSFRYTFFALANVVLVAWTYKIVAPAKVGWTRFTLSLPLFVLGYLVFTLFDYERPSDRNMVIHCVSIYVWLTPWKLTGLSLNRGPLVKAYESRSIAAFVVALLLNVNVAFEATPIASNKKSDDSSSPRKATTGAHDDVKFSVIKYKGKALAKELLSIIGKLVGKVFLQLFFGYLCKMRSEDSLVKSVFCSWYFYAWLSGLQDVSQLFSLLLLNIKLQENFNQPYLSDSFSDFWARRWNLIMGAQLRELCYEPVVQGQWIAPRSYFEKRVVPIDRRLIGTFLTFSVSALVHVVLLCAMLPEYGFQWDYALCFIISPFLVGFETLLRAYTRRSESMEKAAARVPKIARIVFVHVCMQIMGYYTFFPAMHKAGILEKSMDSLFSTFNIQPPIGGANFQKLEL